MGRSRERNPITEAQRREIVRLYRDTDLPVESIAFRFDVSPTYPVQLAKRAGLSGRRGFKMPKAIAEKPENLADAMLEEEPPSANVPSSHPGLNVVEVRRLREVRKLPITHIAALMRVPYRDIVAALDL